MKIEFVSTIAVITPDAPGSRRLYGDSLGLPLQGDGADQEDETDRSLPRPYRHHHHGTDVQFPQQGVVLLVRCGRTDVLLGDVTEDVHDHADLAVVAVDGGCPDKRPAVLARRPNTSGAGKLRRVLRGDVHVLLGKLEKGFFRRLEEVDFPLPKPNRPAGGRRVGFALRLPLPQRKPRIE